MNSAEIKKNKTPKNTMKAFSSLPSCFLTPESVEKPDSFGRITPTQDQTSSVFLSPPSSLERKSIPNFGNSNFEDPLKLELDFEDCTTRPFLDPRSLRSSLEDEIRRKKTDLITGLLEKNCFKICENICDYLGDRELLRFASVCKTWRSFVEQQHHIRDRWSIFKSQCKEYCILKGKENLGSPNSVKQDSSSQNINLKRQPLVNIAVNKVTSSAAITSKRAQLPNLPQQKSTPVTTTPSENFRPCPKCLSPSNYAKVLGSHCCCQRCGLEFCSVCLKDTKNHKEQFCRGLESPCERMGLDAPCEGMETRSKARRKGKDSLAGTRKIMKDRIRRL